jgi:hypothetical protein
MRRAGSEVVSGQVRVRRRYPARVARSALLALSLATPQVVQAQSGETDCAPSFGFAGVLSSRNKEDLPPLTLGAGQPVSDAPWTLKSGRFYEVEIVSDGSQELGLAGPEFFRSVWIDEIVVNGLEIRPLGLDSIEFDEAGTVEIGFLAIRPGSYYLKIPGTRGETQRVEITIE